MGFPTRQDFVRISRDEILSQNSALALDAVDRDGADANVIVAAISAAADEVINQLADVEAGQFLDSAEGTKLDRWVFDRYQLVRKPPAPAFGSVEFRLAAANPAAFTIPVSLVLSTSDGRQYVTTQATVFPLASLGPIVAPVRSVLAGLKQQAAALAITSIVGTISGSPAGITLKNSLATAGAADGEKDADLRDRARRFFTTAEKGTLKAIEAGALAVAGVRRATALEIIDVSGRPARVVQLIIADGFTDALANLGANPISYQTQSQQLALTVFNSLSNVRAAGIYVQVLVAQIILQPVLLNLHFQAGVNVDLVANTTRSTIVAFVNNLAPGATLDPADLLTAISTVPGLDIKGDEIQSPPGTVDPTPLQVIRTMLALVSASVSSGTQIGLSANPDVAFILGAT